MSEALKKLTFRDEILNLKLEWVPLKEEETEKCQDNIVFNETDESNIPLNLLIDPLQSESTINEDLVSENSNSMKSLNPNSFCSVNDTYSWVEVKEENIYNEEEDDAEENNDVSDPTTITTTKPTVSDAQAIKALNKVLIWAEENETEYSDVLVLKRLRSTAIKKNLNQKIAETNFFK